MNNLEKIWEGDELNRQEEGIFLQRYIENIYHHSVAKDTSFVLNINSEWGHGKSFFLQRLAEQLKQNHPVVFFDAWKNDFTEDALLSFVSVVCDDLSKQYKSSKAISAKVKAVEASFKKIMAKALPILMQVLAKHLTGMTLKELTGESGELSANASSTAGQLANVATTTLIKDFLQRREGIEGFKRSIDALVKEIEKPGKVQLPICIVVDELDRCRPTYAIELLESIKHLFDVKGVVFVLATDTKELAHSVKAVYGQDFSSTAYLKRFFAAEYSLSEPDCEKFATYLFRSSTFLERLFLPGRIAANSSIPQFFALTSRYFRLTARDQHQVYAILCTLIASSDKHVFQFPFLLLLIVIKHKFELECREVLLHKNSKAWGNFAKELHMKNRVQEQKFHSQYWNDGGGRSRECAMSELFAYYFTIVSSDRERQSSTYRTGWEHESEIERQSPTGLTDYFQMISQAGRISVVN